MTALRSNYITGILYPEHYNNCFNDMVEQVESLRCSYCISPLHDLDKLKNGKEEKPHYHLILAFSSQKSFKQAVEFMEHVDGVRPELVFDIGGMTRYLTHYDVKDERKVKYYKFSMQPEPFTDLVTYGLGFPYTDFFYRLGSANDFPSRALQIIHNNDCQNYYEFLKIVMSQNQYKSMLNWVSKSSAFIKDMISLHKSTDIYFQNTGDFTDPHALDSKFDTAFKQVTFQREFSRDDLLIPDVPF